MNIQIDIEKVKFPSVKTVGGGDERGERFKRPIDYRESVTSPFSEGPAEPEISYQKQDCCAQPNNRSGEGGLNRTYGQANLP